MTIIDKVKARIKDYEAENGPIHEDDYEKLFVKFYLELRKDPSQPKLNHKKNGLR